MWKMRGRWRCRQWRYLVTRLIPCSVIGCNNQPIVTLPYTSSWADKFIILTPRNLGLLASVTRCQLVNKPLSAVGILEVVMYAADRLSEKWTVGREAKVRKPFFWFSIKILTFQNVFFLFTNDGQKRKTDIKLEGVYCLISVEQFSISWCILANESAKNQWVDCKHRYR